MREVWNGLQPSEAVAALSFIENGIEYKAKKCPDFPEIKAGGGYTPMIFYNTEIKISGRDITLRRYEKKQARGYGRKERGGSNTDDKRHEANIFGLELKYLVKNEALGSPAIEKEYTDEEKAERFLKSVNRAKTAIYDIISCNVGEWGNHTAKFVTLTFRDDVPDIKEANAEFTRFIKDLNYHMYDSRSAVLKYICIPELQKRGTWHYHVLFFNLPLIPVNAAKVKELKAKKGKNGKPVLDAEYPDGKNLMDIWKKGFVGINSIKHDARVAAYVTKYLTKGVEVDAQGHMKYRTEGEDEGLKRLSDYGLYKSLGLENMKRYQASRGLHRPKVFHVAAEKKVVDDMLKGLKQDGKLLQLDKEKNVMTRYEGHNEYRGNYVVVSCRINKKYLNSYVESVDKLSRETRQRHIVKLNPKKMNRFIWDEHKEKRQDYRRKAAKGRTDLWTWAWMTDEEISALPWGETMVG